MWSLSAICTFSQANHGCFTSLLVYPRVNIMNLSRYLTHELVFGVVNPMPCGHHPVYELFLRPEELGISRFPDWQTWRKMDDVTMFLSFFKYEEPWGSRFSKFDLPIDAWFFGDITWYNPLCSVLVPNSLCFFNLVTSQRSKDFEVESPNDGCESQAPLEFFAGGEWCWVNRFVRYPAW